MAATNDEMREVIKFDKQEIMDAIDVVKLEMREINDVVKTEMREGNCLKLQELIETNTFENQETIEDTNCENKVIIETNNYEMQEMIEIGETEEKIIMQITDTGKQETTESIYFEKQEMFETTDFEKQEIIEIGDTKNVEMFSISDFAKEINEVKSEPSITEGQKFKSSEFNDGDQKSTIHKASHNDFKQQEIIIVKSEIDHAEEQEVAAEDTFETETQDTTELVIEISDGIVQEATTELVARPIRNKGGRPKKRSGKTKIRFTRRRRRFSRQTRIQKPVCDLLEYEIKDPESHGQADTSKQQICEPNSTKLKRSHKRKAGCRPQPQPLGAPSRTEDLRFLAANKPEQAEPSMLQADDVLNSIEKKTVIEPGEEYVVSREEADTTAQLMDTTDLMTEMSGGIVQEGTAVLVAQPIRNKGGRPKRRSQRKTRFTRRRRRFSRQTRIQEPVCDLLEYEIKYPESHGQADTRKQQICEPNPTELKRSHKRKAGCNPQSQPLRTPNRIERLKFLAANKPEQAEPSMLQAEEVLNPIEKKTVREPGEEYVVSREQDDTTTQLMSKPNPTEPKRSHKRKAGCKPQQVYESYPTKLNRSHKRKAGCKQQPPSSRKSKRIEALMLFAGNTFEQVEASIPQTEKVFSPIERITILDPSPPRRSNRLATTNELRCNFIKSGKEYVASCDQTSTIAQGMNQPNCLMLKRSHKYNGGYKLQLMYQPDPTKLKRSHKYKGGYKLLPQPLRKSSSIEALPNVAENMLEQAEGSMQQTEEVDSSKTRSVLLVPDPPGRLSGVAETDEFVCNFVKPGKEYVASHGQTGTTTQQMNQPNIIKLKRSHKCKGGYKLQLMYEPDLTNLKRSHKYNGGYKSLLQPAMTILGRGKSSIRQTEKAFYPIEEITIKERIEASPTPSSNFEEAAVRDTEEGFIPVEEVTILDPDPPRRSNRLAEAQKLICNFVEHETEHTESHELVGTTEQQMYEPDPTQLKRSHKRKAGCQLQPQPLRKSSRIEALMILAENELIQTQPLLFPEGEPQKQITTTISYPFQLRRSERLASAQLPCHMLSENQDILQSTTVEDTVTEKPEVLPSRRSERLEAIRRTKEERKSKVSDSTILERAPSQFPEGAPQKQMITDISYPFQLSWSERLASAQVLCRMLLEIPQTSTSEDTGTEKPEILPSRRSERLEVICPTKEVDCDDLPKESEISGSVIRERINIVHDSVEPEPLDSVHDSIMPKCLNIVQDSIKIEPLNSVYDSGMPKHLDIVHNSIDSEPLNSVDDSIIPECLNIFEDSIKSEFLDIVHDSLKSEPSNSVYDSVGSEPLNSVHDFIESKPLNSIQDSVTLECLNIAHDFTKSEPFNIVHDSMKSEPSNSVYGSVRLEPLDRILDDITPKSLDTFHNSIQLEPLE